jgi:hypothetical protein
MSEYQYFEFAAIDRPLTDGEMAKLRAVSTRAAITPSGFVNHYEWGGLKADPSDWMQRYFDAFVYLADWALPVALRLPRDIPAAELKAFGVKQSLTIDATEDHWILDWSTVKTTAASPRMTAAAGWDVPLRDELIRGDNVSHHQGGLPVPPRARCARPRWPRCPQASQMSAAQTALAAFLEIDADMIAAAAMGSADSSDRLTESVDAWLQSLPPDELRSMLRSIVQADRSNPQREIASRYRAWHRQHTPEAAPEARRRNVAELRSLAVPAGEERRRRDALAREQEAAARRAKRDTQLRLLMSDVDKRWLALHQQAQRGSASAYEQIVRALSDLAEAYAIASDRKTFDRELRRFLVRHAKRGALLRRLNEAGLWQS